MHLTRERINVEEFLAKPQRHSDPPQFFGGEESHHDGIFRCAQDDVTNFKSGASVLFLGICRDHSDGRSVSHLEYEAYEDMAEQMMARLIASVKAQWVIEDVRMLHRLGVVRLGEIAVAIEVCSAHRQEAYAASRFLIESVKHEVPIWKKEFFENGSSEWSLCSHAEFQRSAC